MLVPAITRGGVLKDATGTTPNVNGNISLGVDITQGVVMGAWVDNNSGNYIALPFTLSNGNWYCHFREAQSGWATPPANTQLKVYFWFVPND